MLAAVLMAAALDPGLLCGLLEGMGVGKGAARIAGAKLSVVLGFFGGGAILIGLTWLGRAGRLRHELAQHWAMMEEIAQPLGARVQLFDEQVIGFWAEAQGLRFQVTFVPTRGATLGLFARCPPEQALEVRPLGMGPAVPDAGWEKVTQGRTWELWAQVFVTGLTVDPTLVDALESAFGAGGVSRIRHDSAGIEVEMAHERGLDPRVRLPLAIDAAVALARTNH